MGATCISCKATLGVYVAANVQNIYGTAVFEKLKTKGVEIGAHLASWILSLAFFLREESSCYFSEEETFAEFAIKVCTIIQSFDFTDERQLNSIASSNETKSKKRLTFFSTEFSEYS